MLYGYIDVDGLGASIVPSKPDCYTSLSVAQSELSDYARRYFNDGGEQPLILRLFVGEPDGDEETYGYPDEPDYVFRADCNAFENDIHIEEQVV
jgi:hypothetical protein